VDSKRDLARLMAPWGLQLDLSLLRNLPSLTAPLCRILQSHHQPYHSQSVVVGRSRGVSHSWLSDCPQVLRPAPSVDCAPLDRVGPGRISSNPHHDCSEIETRQSNSLINGRPGRGQRSAGRNFPGTPVKQELARTARQRLQCNRPTVPAFPVAGSSPAVTAASAW
jgi:hypothetical protein